MIPVQTHTNSCNMRLLYCVTQPGCRWAAPHRSNLLPQRHVTALRASASAFNSGCLGSATRPCDADADRCAVCGQPVLLSASTPHDLPQLPSLRLLLGDALPPLSRPCRAQHAVRSGCCADLLSVFESLRLAVWFWLVAGQGAETEGGREVVVGVISR